MSRIGHPVVYQVHTEHLAETVKGKDEAGNDIVLHGSIHHHECQEFAGMVSRTHDDGSHDIVIFPPNRPPVHVDRVPWGDGAHTINYPKTPQDGERLEPEGTITNGDA